MTPQTYWIGMVLTLGFGGVIYGLERIAKAIREKEKR